MVLIDNYITKNVLMGVSTDRRRYFKTLLEPYLHNESASECMNKVVEFLEPDFNEEFEMHPAQFYNAINDNDGQRID